MVGLDRQNGEMEALVNAFHNTNTHRTLMYQKGIASTVTDYGKHFPKSKEKNVPPLTLKQHNIVGCNKAASSAGWVTAATCTYAPEAGNGTISSNAVRMHPLHSITAATCGYNIEASSAGWITASTHAPVGHGRQWK